MDHLMEFFCSVIEEVVAKSYGTWWLSHLECGGLVGGDVLTR
jgi:hypothetical protein